MHAVAGQNTAEGGAFVVRAPPHRLEDTHMNDVCLSVQAGPKICHVLIQAIEIEVAPGKKPTVCLIMIAGMIMSWT